MQTATYNDQIALVENRETLSRQCIAHDKHCAMIPVAVLTKPHRTHTQSVYLIRAFDH